ncbi:putative lipopolysaccharide heptosyltransferase III [Yersinia massiliensis]|uniref:Lipopolysaccharide heptosyltransferase 3 n=1 Tax=Yersinia massiliensis TaxID=419257 RepID=A0AA90XU03_9GAMM|nr:MULTISPECIES: putative lipopolysaccharide heptosyltransferase III [Yersinia]MDA5548253.1 putative lipopolysaccharide heptosyltransferase III [Yersinia massiliensis]NIL26863.1 putative lipopolysaccharide heptosyltransferase III [Yersinia massiliensis]OWF74322.1 putative lipopolysaccharide heptosyltransferase III [Yersinia frederiksenii]PHZ23296.1 putative lipopolysaccharide heptosyltransferase III [Yersinia massiliensis]UZM78554.1 putative lipopolysaccharide heptosyltransferase III [Yersinia
MMNTSNMTQSPTGQPAPTPAQEHNILPAALREKGNIQRILVIKLRHFGDVLLTTPLLSTLKANYPQAKIDVLLYGGTQEMLRENTTVNHAFIVDRGLKHAGLTAQISGEKALFNVLKAQHYDLILNLSDQWRAAAYCRLLKPGFSIGFHYPKRDTWLWRYCHSTLVDIPHAAERHTVLNNLDILEPLQLTDIITDVTMSYGPQDIERVKQLCQQRNISDYILIQPSARWKFKTWASESFSQLINHLTEQGETVLLTGGKDQAELDYIAEIIAGCAQPEQVINLSGLLALPELAVLIDNAKLFIGVDSVAMHMAAALQTPAVVLFGPSNLNQWHPWQAPHTLLWAGHFRTLPHPNEIDTDTTDRYLNAIPVNEVIEAVDAWRVAKGH